MIRVLVFAFLASFLGACAPSSPRTFTFDGADYERVFNVTREAIVDRSFKLARVDARSGLIASQLKPTAGFATPYDTEQQTVGQEWQDFFNDQLREVRVWFRRVPSEPSQPGTSPGPALTSDEDLRDATGPIEATIEVTIHRRRYPGRQVETETTLVTGFWQSRELTRRRVTIGATTPLRRDDRFAAALTRDITETLAEQP